MDYNWMFFSTDGRISRSQYWLYGVLVLGLAALLIAVISTFAFSEEQGDIIYLAGSLLLLWPNIAVQAKRWHDRGKSGWWMLIGFIPIIGSIWALIELCILSGDSDANQYGAAPHEARATLKTA